MNFRDLQIGDRIFLDGCNQRDIVGGEIKPVWHALLVAPQKERASAEALRAKGLTVVYPQREKTWRVRGRRVKKKFPIVSQVIYVRFDREPHWDVLRYRRLIMGVMSFGNRPISIPFAQMRQVMGLQADVEAAEAAKEELKAAQEDYLRIRAGERATITSGVLEGYSVDVTKIEQGRAWWRTLTGLEVTGSLPVGELIKSSD